LKGMHGQGSCLEKYAWRGLLSQSMHGHDLCLKKYAWRGFMSRKVCNDRVHV